MFTVRSVRKFDALTFAAIILAAFFALVLHALGVHLLGGLAGLHAMTFIGQARKRNQILGSIPNDGGTNTPRRIDLRNSGYLHRLRLMQAYDFQFATANPTAANSLAQAGGQMARMTLISNSVGMLYDLTGEMGKVVSAIDDAQRLGAGVLDPAPNSFNAAPALAATTNVWAIDVPIAVHFNNKPWPIGLYQTALNALEVSLEVRFRPLTGAVAGGDPGAGVYQPGGTTTIAQAIRGDLQIQQIYFDPIADPSSQPTLAFVHQWREFQIPITGDGDLDIRMPPSNLYMRMIYWLILAGAPNAQALTKLQLRYGANFSPFEENAALQFANGVGATAATRGGQVVHRMNRTYANMFGAATAGAYTGVFVHDFFSEADNEQDFINSAATTDLRATLSTLGGTYTNPSYVKVAVEQLIPLVVPGPGAGNVQGVS